MSVGADNPEPQERALEAVGDGPHLDSIERYIHSDIFDRVVEDDDDLVGLVAYGLYQQRKRQWMDDLRKEHDRLPTDDELQAHAYGYRGRALRSLRNDAEGILFRFTESVIESRIAILDGGGIQQSHRSRARDA